MARKPEPSQNKIAVRILQFFIILICIAFFVISLVQSGSFFLKTSPVFRVREVGSQNSLLFIKSQTLYHLIGQNIFDIDLVAVQRKLQEEYPQIDRLRIYRQFPNRIYVDAIRRDPFAVIVTRKQRILVDRDGTVLTLTPPSTSNLPVITGLNIDQFAVSGKPLKHSDLSLAIAIIRAVQENLDLESMPVATVDLTNLSQIQFVLINQLKIIISEERIPQKIAMLGIFIKQGGVKPEDINYIDLRFKEPIISKKEQSVIKVKKPL